MRGFTFVFLLLIFTSSFAQSAPNAAQIDGAYTTLAPERGKGGQPTQEIVMQLATLNGQQVLVTAGCHPGCTPIIYRYLEEQSRTLKTPVFFTNAGIYLLRVNDHAFVAAMPDAQLGMQPWSQLKFVNVYAKKGQPLPFDQAQATQWAIQQSHSIMETGTLANMSHGSGDYSIAAPVLVMGKKRDSATITFSEAPNKSITVKTCTNCPTDNYHYLQDESSLTGTPSYANNNGKILFDVKDGVLIWADFKGNYGKKQWQSDYHFNVYAKDIGYIRAIRNEKAKQNAIDQLISHHADTVKQAMDARAAAAKAKQIANQELPPRGMRDKNLEGEISAAAKRWANAWGWKEQVSYAYFKANDWNIKHHPLTGLITGRFIGGVIVMERPDGLCSFHYATFGQDYNGSGYSNTHMVGLVPGQIQLECSAAKI